MVGRANRSKKAWISLDILLLRGERRKLKSVLKKRGIQPQRWGSEMKNKELQLHFEALATEAEVTASKGNFKEIYNISLQLSNMHRPAKRPKLDKEEHTGRRPIEKVGPAF